METKSFQKTKSSFRSCIFHDQRLFFSSWGDQVPPPAPAVPTTLQFKNDGNFMAQFMAMQEEQQQQMPDQMASLGLPTDLGASKPKPSKPVDPAPGVTLYTVNVTGNEADSRLAKFVSSNLPELEWSRNRGHH